MENIVKTTKLILISLLFLFVSIFSTSVFALSSDWVINDKSKVRLISSKTSTDNKDEILLGLEFSLDQGWKTYWKSPGGGGFPQKILWNNSNNIDSIHVDWPTPKSFEILGLTSLGYEDNVIFPLTLKLKDKDKKANINLNVNYLVCKNICIPGNANLSLDIPSGDSKYTNFYHEIEKAKSLLPNKNIDLSPLISVDAKVLKNLNETIINVKAQSNKNFINTNIYIHTPFGLPVVNQKNDYFFNFKKINSTFNYKSKQFSENSFPIEIIVSDNNHNFLFTKDISIEEDSSIIDNSILYVLLISVIGGFILNLMPCVFPVLSIKLLSVLNNQSYNIRLSFVYTALGIITSFFFLALFFLLLKNIGISISWGMQFQEPYFLIFILLVLTLFCLNTLGYFEIQLPHFINGNKILYLGNNFFAKNFFNGFFATILATPCTAPFVGSAVTIAFTQQPLILFSIFISMGLGMSLPYLFVCIYPNSISLLPKSGKWTLYIKYFLSMLLALTIIWVLNILYNFYNDYFVITFLAIVLILLFSFKFNFFKFYILLLSIFILFFTPLFSYFQQNKSIKFNDDWLNFSEVNIEEIVKNNQIVFIDITADWCATCQFNKLNVLDNKKIKSLFKEKNIKLIRANWTKPDKDIDEFLKKYNKFGIPFNAFFSEKYTNGLILPEILNKKNIINILNEIE